LGQTLPRSHHRFVSEYVVGRVSRSDLGSRSDYVDGTQERIPSHYCLNAKNMFNPSPCFGPHMVATLFALNPFLMTACTMQVWKEETSGLSPCYDLYVCRKMTVLHIFVFAKTLETVILGLQESL
jgi:hypothetical protein